jgi:predicted DNA-binding transcriptional regulator AlpA
MAVKHQKLSGPDAVVKKAEPKASTAHPVLSPALLATNQDYIAAAGLAPVIARHRHERQHVHGSRGPPAVRLLDKAEILAITNVTFPTIWAWMRASPPKFPRALVVGGKSMWRSDEIDAWLAALPVRALKGDPPNPPEVV